MVAFNFMSEFEGPITRDEKLQTIRRKHRCMPGAPMHLYTGQRTRACRLIAVRRCVVSDYVHLAPDGLTLGNRDKHPHDVDEFARLDGFRDFAAMLAWFHARYGAEHFVGYVHRWQPLANRPACDAPSPSDRGMGEGVAS